MILLLQVCLFFFLLVMSSNDNMCYSFDVMCRKKVNQFLETYHISESLNPTLPEPNRAINSLLLGKFAFYTRVCDFANYRVHFTKFLMKVMNFHEVHISQVNPFGLSRISNFELSYRARGRVLLRCLVFL
ncbi:hypothetical protein Hanom_Chr09g00805891 [Helianthus anomalus]